MTSKLEKHSEQLMESKASQDQLGESTAITTMADLALDSSDEIKVGRLGERQKVKWGKAKKWAKEKANKVKEKAGKVAARARAAAERGGKAVERGVKEKAKKVAAAVKEKAKKAAEAVKRG